MLIFSSVRPELQNTVADTPVADAYQKVSGVVRGPIANGVHQPTWTNVYNSVYLNVCAGLDREVRST